MSDLPENPNHDNGPTWTPASSSTGGSSGGTPPSAPRGPMAVRKRRINPLAWVLILSGVFFVFFMVISGAIFMSRSSSPKKSNAALFASEGSVGVIELNGVIMDSKKMLKQLDTFAESSDVKAVVLRINSPGGAVAPSQEIYQAVKAYKKPLVVSMASVAASGGYYIACGAKKIFANPGTITGSIGVIMEFANLEKLYEWAKVKRFSIKTGKFKDAGAEYREMEPEERALLQGMVDDVLTQFKQAVAEGRKLKMEEVTPVADGRIFSGSQAKAAHLVDELGTLQDAVDDVAKQAGIKGKANVVYPPKIRRGILDLVLGDSNSDESSSSESKTNLAQRLVSAFVGGDLNSLEHAVSGREPGIYWIWNGAR